MTLPYSCCVPLEKPLDLCKMRLTVLLRHRQEEVILSKTVGRRLTNALVNHRALPPPRPAQCRCLSCYSYEGTS